MRYTTRGYHNWHKGYVCKLITLHNMRTSTPILRSSGFSTERVAGPKMIFREANITKSSFCQLGNSGNSTISVKGKSLTNINMYAEKKSFFKS